MTRRERIVFLLENYIDVVNGLQDRSFRSDDFLPRMCRAWSHPSYKELERLRMRMRDSSPLLYWHVAETYFRARSRRAAICPRCRRIASASLIGEFCRHGKSHLSPAERIPIMEKIVDGAVVPRCVDQGIAWLDDNWFGEPFIPDDLLARAA